MYVVAIPSYKRYNEITTKTLPTLKKGGVNYKNIYVFVANKLEEKLYREKMDPTTYGKIVIGKKGIVQQRQFISKYFPKNTYIISMDDDVECLYKLKDNDKLSIINNLDKFFKDAYKELKKYNLYIWGVYPVKNPFYMKPKLSTNLKFLIGVVHGYINRHNPKLYPSLQSQSKEDYHQSILFFLNDGGVIRFNNVTFKTKFLASGGLGCGDIRFKMNKTAAEFLSKKYPDLVRRKDRKNGMPEIILNYRAVSTNNN